MITDRDGYIKKTARDLSGLLKTGQAAKRVGESTEDLVDAVGKDLSGNKGVRDNGGLMGDYQNKTKLREASVEFKRHDAKTANIL
ncbi:hypothetical protein HOH45_02200, partial [bacterium]|nr:hypothetical protein [bacterium]